MAIKPSSILDKKIPLDEEIIPIRGSELNEWETILARIKLVEAYVPAFVGGLFGIWLATLYFAFYNIKIVHKIDIINFDKHYLIMSLMNSSSYNTSVHHVTGIQNGMTIAEEVPLATTQPQLFVNVLLALFVLTIIAYIILYWTYRKQEFSLIGRILSQINSAKKRHLQKKQ
jgi:hypothetical protein